MRTKEDFLEHLRACGERITMPRLAVIDALYALGGHQTTHSLQHHLEQQGVRLSEPTVYRVVQWLKALALVSQTDLGLSGTTYELLATPLHHHLVCLVCGQTQDLADEALEPLRAVMREQHDFAPRIDHMAFFGVCRACREAEGNLTPRPPLQSS